MPAKQSPNNKVVDADEEERFWAKEGEPPGHL
jgi:hypothetical protein